MTCDYVPLPDRVYGYCPKEREFTKAEWHQMEWRDVVFYVPGDVLAALAVGARLEFSWDGMPTLLTRWT